MNNMILLIHVYKNESNHHMLLTDDSEILWDFKLVTCGEIAYYWLVIQENWLGRSTIEV